MREQYYTLKEMASILNVTPKFLRAEIARGRLQANFFRKEWRVSPADFVAYTRATHTSQLNEDNEVVELRATA